jgi:hypothetical protein
MRKQIRNLDAERLFAFWLDHGRVLVEQVTLETREAKVRLKNRRAVRVPLAELEWSRPLVAM